MMHTLSKCLAAITLLAGTSLLADETKDGKTDPPGVPVEARLTANKTTYTLDLGGKSGEDFRKLVREGDTTRAYPQAPQVDLVLTLRNAGDKEMQIKIGGTTTIVMLVLKGTGALNVPLKGQITNKLIILPKVVTLKPGESQKVPITSLSYGYKGGHRSYWTEPGEFTLAASYKTAVSPAPKDSIDAGGGFGTVTITSTPVRIKVMAKE
jgi:hypothetical protein